MDKLKNLQLLEPREVVQRIKGGVLVASMEQELQLFYPLMGPKFLMQ
jgi:hypothetical protein